MARLIAAAVLPRLAALAAGVRHAAHATGVVALPEAPGGGVDHQGIRPIHRLVDASDAALARGVAVGQRLIDAQGFAPDLRAVAVSARLLDETLDGLAEHLLSLSPLVEAVRPRETQALPFHAVVVDLTGLPRARARLLSDLARVLAEQGQPCTVALSSSRTVSLALARDIAARPRAYRGRLFDLEAAQLPVVRRTLDIAALDLDATLVASLKETGVACVQDLVPLVGQGLVTRLGRAAPGVLRVMRLLGLEAHAGGGGDGDIGDSSSDGANDGDSDGLVKPLVPTEVVGASRDLDHGVTHLEPLLFVLRPLVEGVVRRLVLRRLRLSELTVALGARRRTPTVVTVPLATPTVDVDVIVRVLSTRLERVFAEAACLPGPRARGGGSGHDDDDTRLLLHQDGVERIMLLARRTVSSSPRQLGLGTADERGPPEALLHLISELQARYGDDNVGVPAVSRARLPEEMGVLVWPPPRTATLLDEPQAHTKRRRRPRPVVQDPRTSHGRFAAGWPWPLRLLKTPVALPFNDADVVKDQPFAILEGDDAKGPYRRRYRQVTLHDGRRALILVDDDAGLTTLQGWFE